MKKVSGLIIFVFLFISIFCINAMANEDVLTEAKKSMILSGMTMIEKLNLDHETVALVVEIASPITPEKEVSILKNEITKATKLILEARELIKKMDVMDNSGQIIDAGVEVFNKTNEIKVIHNGIMEKIITLIEENDTQEKDDDREKIKL